MVALPSDDVPVTPEGKIKRKVRELLSQFEVYSFAPVQMGYGARTLDFLGCHNGRFFAIETKADGKKLTEQQEWIRQRILKAGGECFVIATADVQHPEWERLRLWLAHT